MKKIIIIIAAIYVSAKGASLTITPSNIQGWAPYDIRGAGTAVITANHPLNGDGSLKLNLTTSTDKAGFAYQWNPIGVNPFDTATTLGNIDTLGYHWLRNSSSTVPNHLQPSIKIMWWNDNDSNNNFTVGDTSGFLVWESVYNSNPGNTAVPTDTWQTQNVISSNLWQWTTGKGANENYNVDISEWITGGGLNHANSTPLSANTYIYGVIVDSGSGWNGIFEGAVDNTSIGFSGNSILSNFEVIPEPSTNILISVFSIIGLLRRKR